jgi:hypothetical protein
MEGTASDRDWCLPPLVRLVPIPRAGIVNPDPLVREATEALISGYYPDELSAVERASNSPGREPHHFGQVRDDRGERNCPAAHGEGKCECSVTRLTIRLSGTAALAPNPTPCMRTGSLNSPPPSPTRPLRAPIGTHQPTERSTKEWATERALHESTVRRQPTEYSGDLKVEWRTPSGASESFRMSAHVCL